VTLLSLPWWGGTLQATGQKRKGVRADAGTGTVAARWRRQSRRAALGQEQSGVARAGSAKREGARAALELGATRGVKCSRRWRGRPKTVVSGGAKEQRSARGRREREGVRGTSLIFSKISGTPLRSKISH
jgi:hypothetical protein